MNKRKSIRFSINEKDIVDFLTYRSWKHNLDLGVKKESLRRGFKDAEKYEALNETLND